jgi:hypothetical protein
MIAEHASGEKYSTGPINPQQLVEPKLNLNGLVPDFFSLGQKFIELYQQLSKDGLDNLGMEVAKAVVTGIDEYSRLKPGAIESTTDLIVDKLPFVPSIVKPVVKNYAKELTRNIGTARWDNLVDYVGIAAKQVGKDPFTGEYRTTREILESSTGKFLQKMIVDYLRGYIRR